MILATERDNWGGVPQEAWRLLVSFSTLLAPHLRKKRMFHNPMFRKLRMESLEDKVMLAADLLPNNVTVTVVDGDMFVVGTDTVEDFVIGNISGVAGEFFIASESGTTINGSSSGGTFTGVTGDVFVDLGGGDDTFRSGNVTYLGNLKIKSGEGNDQVLLGQFPNTTTPVPVSIAKDLVFFDIGGDDLFLARDTSVGDDLRFRMGDGNDAVFFDSTQVADKVRGRTGAGDDDVFFNEMTVGTSVAVSLGSGVDSAEFSDADFGRSLSVIGRGSNAINVNGVTTSHFITILTANGDDEAILDGVTTSSALVRTGGGEDSVIVFESTFDNLIVLLGSGDDSLEIGGVVVNRFAFLSGGSGNDTYTLLEPNDFNFDLTFGFEEFFDES